MIDKIGLDFHGVISAAPENFAVFCHEIRKRGIKVYVISGGPSDDIKKYLQTHDIEYDVLWAILDTCEAQGSVHFYDDGSFQVPTDIWNKAKAKYCAEQGILFHVDDSQIYGRYFVTPYCQYNIKSGCCSVGENLVVDFNCPREAAAIISGLLKKSETA